MQTVCQICGVSIESERASRKFCDVCRKARKKAVTARTYSRAYHAKYMQRYYATHPEYKQRKIERIVRNDRANPTDKKRRDAAYYQRHKDQVKANVRAYAQANREKMLPFRRAALVRYRARLANAEGDFTAQQFLELCEACSWYCAYCLKQFDKLTPDHITPLSRGGSNDISNIIPACLSCNAAKRDRTPLEL
jgi:5-methylcytosine-specific restriction endonuclease McrA